MGLDATRCEKDVRLCFCIYMDSQQVPAFKHTYENTDFVCSTSHLSFVCEDGHVLSIFCCHGYYKSYCPFSDFSLHIPYYDKKV